MAKKYDLEKTRAAFERLKTETNKPHKIRRALKRLQEAEKEAKEVQSGEEK